MELSSMILNNTIVKFRKVVGQAKYRVTRKLIRRINDLKKKTLPDTVEGRKKKNDKKLERYVEDVQALKKLKPDDVSKFALLNTKTLQELKISGRTPAPDRVLYKVATSELLVSAVEEFREKYPEWHREVPFMLQRLGMQYKFRKGDRDASDIKKLLTKMKLADAVIDDEEELEEEDDEEPVDEIEKPTGDSLLTKVKLRRKEEKLATKKKMVGKKLKSKLTLKLEKLNRRKEMKKLNSKKTLKKKKVKEDPSSESDDEMEENLEPTTSTSITEGRTGQMEIRRLRMELEDDDQSVEKPGATELATSSSRVELDPFFLGAADVGVKKGIEKEEIEVEKSTRPKSGVYKNRKELRMEKGISSKPFKPILTKSGESREPRKVRFAKQEDIQYSATKQSTNKDESQLHPSWEAKRKQRLLQKATLKAPMGKKIKFD